jgi:hypothetical protein
MDKDDSIMEGDESLLGADQNNNKSMMVIPPS